MEDCDKIPDRKSSNHDSLRSVIKSGVLIDSVLSCGGSNGDKNDQQVNAEIIDQTNKDENGAVNEYGEISLPSDPINSHVQPTTQQPSESISEVSISTLVTSIIAPKPSQMKILDAPFTTTTVQPKPKMQDSTSPESTSTAQQFRHEDDSSFSSCKQDKTSDSSHQLELDNKQDLKTPHASPSPPSSTPSPLPSSTTVSTPETETHTTHMPCPSSPHLRSRFSVVEKSRKTQPQQCSANSGTLELSKITKDTSGESPSTPSSPRTSSTSSKKETDPYGHTDSSNHSKSRFSKMGGCFHRLGSFGRKKKRKLSSKDSSKGEDEANLDDESDSEDYYNGVTIGHNDTDQDSRNVTVGTAHVEKNQRLGEKEDNTGKILQKEDDKKRVTPISNEPNFDSKSDRSLYVNEVTIDTSHTIDNNDNTSDPFDDNTSNINEHNNNNNSSNQTCINDSNIICDVKSKITSTGNSAEAETQNDLDKIPSNLSKEEPEISEKEEEVDTIGSTMLDDPFKFSRSRIRPGSFRFRRAFSQRTRMKPLMENVVSGSGGDSSFYDDGDSDDVGDLSVVQFTAAAENASSFSSSSGVLGGRRAGTFHRRAFSLKRHFHSNSSSGNNTSSSFDTIQSSPHSENEHGTSYKSYNSKDNSSNGNDKGTRRHHQVRRTQSMRSNIMSFFVNLQGNDKTSSSPFSRAGSVNKHSLASVELSSWASRGSTRRSGTLPPFSSSLGPLGVTTRSEILQTISSSIIQLFQRKRLRENELGVLQEHVRFLIETEAGGLIYEYYKDQLLRKGMVILREKIKNEQGLDLLNMLGETWDYFFREILPNLQAILYPLAPVMANDESIRSLSLLAFRNIVVLKVSIREALDSVNKHSFPPSMQQMLLILQGITDNVFLSENQFLLEKLVARVVCPYMGQRGVYEGGPEPVIKVKLKPLPLNIPLTSSADTSDKTKAFTTDTFKPTSSLSPRDHLIKKPGCGSGTVQNGSEGGLKLNPVMEHLNDNGRRHSVVS